MKRSVLHGEGRHMVRTSEAAWRRALERVPAAIGARLAFMTPGHHAVRDFVVREMPGRRTPMPPLQIARETGLPVVRVDRILDELERKLFFLVRDGKGAVPWAYPVTVARTPHRLRFSTGERTFGA